MAKRRQRLSLDLLKGFEAAARHLSFTHAAKELFVTQSAVSREVRTLEEQLGSPLFRRIHRGLRLTESGQLLYRAAADAFRLIDEATQQLAGSSGSQQVTVTTVTSFAALWLVPRLAQFTSLHPDVEVRVAASNKFLDLERERIDVGIRLFLAGTPTSGTLLMKDRAFPMCAPAYLQDRSRPLRTAEDLSRHALLRFVSDRGDDSWDDWRVWLQRSGLGTIKPQRSVRFSHYEQVVHAAMSGHGVALAQMPMLSRHFRDGLLASPLGRKAVDWGAFHLIAAPRATDRPPVKAFLNWLRDEARSASRER
jgi:DNA-binding transcriptional LysR family regulator